MIRRRQLTAPVVLLATAFAGGCAASVHATGSAPVPPIPFTASSMQSAFGIQGRFEGVMTVSGDWIDVAVTTAALRGFQGDPVHYSDLQVRAAVATCVAKGNRQVAAVVSESRAVKLAPVFAIGTRTAGLDSATRTTHDTLRFSVATPRGAAPERSWLAFVFEWPFENSLASYEMHADAALAGHGARRPNC